MEMTSSSETSQLHIQQSTQCPIPEDLILPLQCCEKLKTHMQHLFWNM